MAGASPPFALETQPADFGHDMSQTQPMQPYRGELAEEGSSYTPFASMHAEPETQPGELPADVAPGRSIGAGDIEVADADDDTDLGATGFVLPDVEAAAAEADPESKVYRQIGIRSFFGTAGALPATSAPVIIPPPVAASAQPSGSAPSKRRQSGGGKVAKAAKGSKGSDAASTTVQGGVLAAFGLTTSRWQDVDMESRMQDEEGDSRLETKIMREPVAISTLEDVVPLLWAAPALTAAGRAIFAQLPKEWLDFSSRKDALSVKCLFSSRRHEHSIFEPIATDNLLGLPEALRSWQAPTNMPSNALNHAALADDEPWAVEAHPGSGHVRVTVRPGVLFLRMLRRGTALPAARFTWRLKDAQEGRGCGTISIEDQGEESSAGGTRVHALAAQMGEFSILSNVEDAAYTQPPRFVEFPLRREQLRSLGWMVSQERKRQEAFVTELRESAAFVDAPHWKLEGRLHCEYGDVKGGVLADAIGYGKTACTIGLIDCTSEDAFPQIPAPFKGLLPSRATLVLAPTNLHAQWLAEIIKFTGSSLKVLSVPTCSQLKRLKAHEVMEADVVVATYRLFYSTPYMQRLQEVAREIRKDFSFPSMYRTQQAGKQRQSATPEWAKAYRQAFEVLPVWARKLRTSSREPVTPTRSAGARSQKQEVSPASTDKSSKQDASAAPAARVERRVRGKTAAAEVSKAEAVDSDTMEATMTQDLTASQAKRRRITGKQAVTEDPKPDHSAAWRGLLDGSDWSPNAQYIPLEAFWWRRVVCDEFHELLSRYPPAQVAVELFHADYKWGLSGTPPCRTLTQIRKAAGFFGVQIPTAAPGDAEGEAPRQVAQEWLDAFVRRNTAELPDLEEEEHIIEVQQTEREKALYVALTQGQATQGQAEDSFELDGNQTQDYRQMHSQLPSAAGMKLPPELQAAQQNTSGLLKLCSHFCVSGAADVLTAADECERQLAIRREAARSAERELRSVVEKVVTTVSLIRHFEPHFCKAPDATNYGFLKWESKKTLTARLAFLGVRMLGTKSNLSSRFLEVLESETASSKGDAALSEAAKSFVLRVDFDAKCKETAKDMKAEETPVWAKLEAMLAEDAETPFPQSGAALLKKVLQENAGKFDSKSVPVRCAKLRSNLGMPKFAGSVPVDDVVELLGTKKRKTKAQLLHEQEWEWLSDAENAKSLRKVTDAWKREVQNCSTRVFDLVGQLDAKQHDLESFQDTLSSTQLEAGFAEEAEAAVDGSAEAATNFAKYGSKIEALVKHVQRLHSEDQGCKVICFVQWEDLKRKISSALQEFQVPHLTLHGSIWARRAALVRFQYEEDSPRMLLLSLQESASGTNLTAANHVIIVHPMEAATREEAVAYEMQAMGRVRRPGQTRKIHIWRFVTVNTVEQVITEQHQKDLWERQHAKVEVNAPPEDLGDSDSDVDGEPLTTEVPSTRQAPPTDDTSTQVYMAVEPAQDLSADLHREEAGGLELATQAYMAYQAPCDEETLVFAQ